MSKQMIKLKIKPVKKYPLISNKYLTKAIF